MYRRVSTGFFIFKYRIFYWIKQILYKVIENFLSVFEKGYPKNKKYTRWSNKWTYEVEIVADVTSFHRMFRRHRKFTLNCVNCPCVLKLVDFDCFCTSFTLICMADLLVWFFQLLVGSGSFSSRTASLVWFFGKFICFQNLEIFVKFRAF